MRRSICQSINHNYIKYTEIDIMDDNNNQVKKNKRTFSKTNSNKK